MTVWRLSSQGVSRDYDEIDKQAIIVLVIRDKGFKLELLRDDAVIATIDVQPGARSDLARLFGSLIL